MTETTGYLGNHKVAKLSFATLEQPTLAKAQNNWKTIFRGRKVFKTHLPCLGKIGQFFFLYPACPVWLSCILSVVDAWAVPCPKVSYAKKKTRSKQSVFSTQHSLGNRSVLPAAIVPHINRILSYLDAIFYSSLKWLKMTYLSGMQSLCI